MADLIGVIRIEVYDNGQLRLELPEGVPQLTQPLFSDADRVPEQLRQSLGWWWFNSMRIGRSHVGLFVGLHDSPSRAFDTAASVFRTLDGSK